MINDIDLMLSPGNLYVTELTAVVPYILRVDMTDWAGNTAYALYSNFVLGGAETNYTILSLGNYSGTAGARVSMRRGAINMLEAKV